MNQIICFSPVGGNRSHLHEQLQRWVHAAHLQAVSAYPVILYMSREVLENQEADDRYRYALRKLFELQKREHVEICEIERPELTSVHEFDYFYEDFRNIIGTIFASMDETDRLLINVSSGTPAMKSGLLVLQT